MPRTNRCSLDFAWTDDLMSLIHFRKILIMLTKYDCKNSGGIKIPKLEPEL